MSEIVVSGTFKNESALQRAIARLRDRGISLQDISYVKTPHLPGKSFDLRLTTKASEGLAAGLLLGGVVGAAFAGFGHSGMVTDTMGMVLYSGPWVAALTGVGPGAVLGGFAGWLIGHKIPDYHAVLSDESEVESPLLLGVTVDEQSVEDIDSLLQTEGASRTARLDKRFQTEAGL